MKLGLIGVAGMVIAALVLLTGANLPQPAKPKLASKGGSFRGIAEDCTFQDQKTKDTHSQTFRYRGEGLERLDWFKGQEGGVPALLFPGQGSGSPQSLVVHGHHQVSARSCPITLEAVSVSEPSFAGLRFFRPKIGDNNLCGDERYEDREGKFDDALKGLAISVPGYWKDGVWLERADGADVFTLSCVSGAVAKCALWGYKPWEGRGDYHRACIQAARARYLRNRDDSFTCNGTQVEIFDRDHILSNTHPEGFTFESLWDETGLVCIGEHARWGGCEGNLRDVRRCSVTPSDSGDNWPRSALLAVASRLPPHESGRCPTEPNACAKQAEKTPQPLKAGSTAAH